MKQKSAKAKRKKFLQIKDLKNPLSGWDILCSNIALRLCHGVHRFLKGQFMIYKAIQLQGFLAKYGLANDFSVMIVNYMIYNTIAWPSSL